MKNQHHCHSAPWRPEPRCTGCGHRVMNNGVVPRQTRELNPLLWPFELITRVEARLRRRLKAN